MIDRTVTPKRTDYRRRFVVQLDVVLDEGSLGDRDLTRDDIEDVWSNITDGLGSVDFQEHGAQVLEHYYASEIASIEVQAVDDAPKVGAKLVVQRNHIIRIPWRRSA